MSKFIFSGKVYEAKASSPSSSRTLSKIGDYFLDLKHNENGSYSVIRTLMHEERNQLSLVCVHPGQTTESLFGRREDQGGKRKSKNTAGSAPLTLEFSAKITDLCVGPQVWVEEKTILVRLEAMKMEFLIKAPTAGFVKQFKKKVGDIVQAGELMLEFETKASK